MYALFGVSNTSIFDFAQNLKGWVEEAGHEIAPYRPTLLGFDQEWPEDIKGIVLVPTVSLFLQRLPLLEEAKAVVFVFDAAIQLEYLKPIEILDLLEKRQSFVYRFKPLDGIEVVHKIVQARKHRESIEVEQATLDVIPRLLSETKSSLLSPILTFLYGVKDTSKRHEYQKTIYGWMKSTSAVKTLIDRLPEGKAAVRLKEFFESEVGVNTMKAVREMVAAKSEGKQANAEKLAKKYDLTPFDLRYLNAAMNKAENVKDYGAGKPVLEMGVQITEEVEDLIDE